MSHLKFKGRNPLGAIQSPELNISVSDCTCPICLEILVEPVVLPCKHELCLSCFSGMTDKTNFLCPMCRMRISTWSRTASNNNTLVNKDRWKQIQRAFPKEIAERVEGKTAERIEQQIREEKENIAKANAVAVSKQGEIQREYELLLAREQERVRAEREQEEQESLQYIQQVIVSWVRLSDGGHTLYVWDVNGDDFRYGQNDIHVVIVLQYIEILYLNLSTF